MNRFREERLRRQGTRIPQTPQRPPATSPPSLRYGGGQMWGEPDWITGGGQPNLQAQRRRPIYGMPDWITGQGGTPQGDLSLGRNPMGPTGGYMPDWMTGGQPQGPMSPTIPNFPGLPGTDRASIPTPFSPMQFRRPFGAEELNPMANMFPQNPTMNYFLNPARMIGGLRGFEPSPQSPTPQPPTSPFQNRFLGGGGRFPGFGMGLMGGGFPY